MPLFDIYGRQATTDVVRDVLAELRGDLRSGKPASVDADAIAQAVAGALERRMAPGLRPVFNLTGTVLHAISARPSPQAALEAIALTARARPASNST